MSESFSLMIFNSLGIVVGHYHYSLSATGRREVITEPLTRRTSPNCYDALYRLTDEVIFNRTSTSLTTEGCLSDTTGANYTVNYEYDWVGNRTYETVDGVQTAYQFEIKGCAAEQGR